ncbi:MAG: hypothetical protein RMJ65_05850, partial [candidate division WOR-3 bacterium]|nr:hypothetical protein [candidate division WOR-3 bacterium]
MRLIITFLCLFCILNARTTFFSEDFNSNWTTTTPPSGWRIYYDAPVGPEDWHRATLGHWQENTSGYALISYDRRAHNTVDSLISPLIDCSRYRNVQLRCSLYFQHNSGNYTAKIVGSTDGGITYPYIIKDLYGNYTLPYLETLDLSWASRQSNVRIAFVFEGNILNINFWCLDNISLVGDWIYNLDVAPVEITQPKTIQPPGECTLQVKIANLGLNTAYNISVTCSLYNFWGLPLHYAETSIESILSQETLNVKLTPSYIFSIPGFYSVKFRTNLLGDENLSNDTISANFSVAWSEILGYSDDIPDTSLFFPTREEGWGIKFTPRHYPALINYVQCYFDEYLYSPYRYIIRIVDDDGPEGRPQTTIYETPIITASGSGWKTAYLVSQEIYIDSGSVYIFYIQADDAPYTPLFFCDEYRDSINYYYKYYNDQYIPAYPPGDFLMRVSFEYRTPIRYNYDLRVVNIEKPQYELIRRPYNYQTPVVIRIGNFGLREISNFSVVCTVRSYIGGFPGVTRKAFYQIVPNLGPRKETILNIGNWQVMYVEPILISAKVILGIDQNPSNNYKEKVISVYSGKFTDREGEVGYAWIDSDTITGPNYNWYNITSAYQLLDYGDDTVFALPLLPFTFPFYDTTYRRIYVSTNGFIGFSATLPASPNNETIPSINAPNGALYAFWDDLVLPQDRSAKIYYQDLGSAPNRFRVITWYNVLRKNTHDTCRLNFQIILYENGDIIYQYKDLNTGESWASFGKSATVGIEDRNGNRGLLYLYGGDSLLVNWPKNKLSSGRAIKFYKQYHDVGIVSIITPKESIFPLPITPVVKIKNYGTTEEETVKIYLKIISLSGSVVYDTFLNYFYLLPNTEVLITFWDWNAYSGN